MGVVSYDWFSVAGRLGEPDIAWNYGLKNLKPVEVTQVRGHRGRQIRAFVIHREEKSFDHETGIVQASDSSQGVEEFGDTLQRVVFTLNWNQQRLRCRERVQRQ